MEGVFAGNLAVNENVRSFCFWQSTVRLPAEVVSIVVRYMKRIGVIHGG